MTIARVLSGEARYHVACCRAEELEELLPDGSVSLILTDPPFHKVKDLAWDREHKTAVGFLDWIGDRFRAWRRILAPNGSLYVFASPAMAWGVEGKVREHFEVLTNIRWAKPPHSTKAEMFRKEDLRAPFPASETILFAEQVGFAHESVRAYLESEVRASGRSISWVRDQIGFTGQMPYHWFAVGMPRGTCQQWQFPTEEHYLALQRICPGHFARSYADLAAEHDALRRPFSVSAEVPYTDVWTYPTVQAYPGKHPCEKPPKMALDMVRASSREGGLVVDFFSGSGVFAAAAVALGRRAIACDMDPHWVDVTSERCARAEETGDIARVPRRAPAKPPESGPRVQQLDLFAPRAA